MPRRGWEIRDLPDVSRGIGIAGEAYPDDPPGAVLDVILAQLFKASRSASERRHDPDRPRHLPRSGNRPLAVSKSRIAESERSRPIHQRPHLHRERHHRHQGWKTEGHLYF